MLASHNIKRELSADEELLMWLGSPLMAEGDHGRIAAITREFAQGFAALTQIKRAVSVFGSARTLSSDPDYQLTRDVGKCLGQSGYSVITGGGPGAMEAANRGAQEVGALSVGLGIELPRGMGEPLNNYLDIPLFFEHFFVRKVMFVRYASAFVIVPGGFGTFDELFEALTLIQTATIHHFPLILVDDGFWDGLIDWLEGHVAKEGKVAPGELQLIKVAQDPSEVCKIVNKARARQRKYYAQR